MPGPYDRAEIAPEPPAARGPSPRPRGALSKLLAIVGSVIGGYVGWAIGEPVGLFTAFVISVVGTGVGIYWGRRIGRRYEA